MLKDWFVTGEVVANCSDCTNHRMRLECTAFSKAKVVRGTAILPGISIFDDELSSVYEFAQQRKGIDWAT